jgi:hypothetical protein
MPVKALRRDPAVVGAGCCGHGCGHFSGSRCSVSRWPRPCSMPWTPHLARELHLSLHRLAPVIPTGADKSARGHTRPTQGAAGSESSWQCGPVDGRRVHSHVEPWECTRTVLVPQKLTSCSRWRKTAVRMQSACASCPHPDPVDSNSSAGSDRFARVWANRVVEDEELRKRAGEGVRPHRLAVVVERDSAACPLRAEVVAAGQRRRRVGTAVIVRVDVVQRSLGAATDAFEDVDLPMVWPRH